MSRLKTEPLFAPDTKAPDLEPLTTEKPLLTGREDRKRRRRFRP